MKILTLLFVAMAICESATAQTNTNKFKPYVPPVQKAVPLGEPRPITIIGIDGVMSKYYKCKVIVEGAAIVYLAGVPPTLSTEFNQANGLASYITKETESIKLDSKRLKAELAAAPSEAAYDSPAGNYIRQLNIRQNKIEERKSALKEKSDELSDLMERIKQNSELWASNTGRLYGSTQIWQVVPKPVAPTVAPQK